MFRKAVPSDYDPLSQLWLRASLEAHDFINPEFWEDNVVPMRDIYLPGAETWVEDEGGKLSGFISLAGDVVAALFVDPALQGRGIGTTLLNKAGELRGQLELSVYVENARAVSFYEKHGFSRVNTRKDEHTGHDEYVMVRSS